MNGKFFCNNCKTSKKFIVNAVLTKELSVDESGNIIEELMILDKKISYAYECQVCKCERISRLSEKEYKKINFINECSKEVSCKKK